MDHGYAVLEVLAREQGVFATVDAIASRAVCGEVQVTEAIEHLLRLGVPIESHPAYGLRITVPFDLIDRMTCVGNLKARGLAWPVYGVLETASTNDLATSAALDGADDGTTFFAEHQTKGRGRLGRAWHSPVGSGLWFSVLSRKDFEVRDGWRVTLGAGLAVAHAITELTGLAPGLKWPNDVQIDGRKVAGILTESKAEGGRLKHSVIGIGINVHLEQDEFPNELRETACSIHSVGGRVTRGDLLVEILLQLKQWLDTDAKTLRSAWSEGCRHWNERVRVEQGDEVVEGVARELADDGSFVIERDDGSTYAVHAGDLTHLRMAT